MPLFTENNVEKMTRSELIMERDNIFSILYFVARGTLKLDPDRMAETRETLEDIQRALDAGEYQQEVAHAAVN
jgi:hypothetical protein